MPDTTLQQQHRYALSAQALPHVMGELRVLHAQTGGFPIRVDSAMPSEYKPTFVDKVAHFAEHFQLNPITQYAPIPEPGLVLTWGEAGLGLCDDNDQKMLPLQVDFTSPALAYRKDKGGGRNEAIAKAVGVKGQTSLHVVDATAGLGTDSFVLAAVGCHVTMVERTNVVCALLCDGLQRLHQHAPESDIAQRLGLVCGHAPTVLANGCTQQAVDVVYLDPMFPHKKKSAAVKKPMKMFQTLLGFDEDADDLLTPALALAKKRVVVKRPNYADFLQGQPPSMQIKGKKHRFDVYLS
jgi:16S rRNA (guanine1516-N2)-methyltransferase